MKGLLVAFHCGRDAGFAINRLAEVFLAAGSRCLPGVRIHTAFQGRSQKAGDDAYFSFNSRTSSPSELRALSEYIRQNEIDTILGFDQQVRQPYYARARKAGVKTIISYWGAPISGINSGWKLLAKKAEVALSRHGPDAYIFESRAMARTATHGRGIPARKVHVVPLGVDVEKFKPVPDSRYGTELFGIPPERKIVYYSGHMEPRKGVRVIMGAANELVAGRGRRDVHFLLMGNKNGEEQPFLDMLQGEARDHVTFGGYRDDVEKIIPGCDIGCIASTGWDSFTMSSIEMAACGLPLLVSDLQGLAETVAPGETGFTFEPGNHTALADRIEQLLDDPDLCRSMSTAARERVVAEFSVERQIESLANILRKYSR